MSKVGRYLVWCNATRPLPGRRGFCGFQGYRKSNPHKRCPQCGDQVSVYDRETREPVDES